MGSGFLRRRVRLLRGWIFAASNRRKTENNNNNSISTHHFYLLLLTSAFSPSATSDHSESRHSKTSSSISKIHQKDQSRITVEPLAGLKHRGTRLPIVSSSGLQEPQYSGTRQDSTSSSASTSHADPRADKGVEWPEHREHIL